MRYASQQIALQVFSFTHISSVRPAQNRWQSRPQPFEKRYTLVNTYSIVPFAHQEKVVQEVFFETMMNLFFIL